MNISLGYLEVAQTQGIEVCYALIEDMPWEDEIFDIVICTDVLEHVLDLNLACTKILSVLREAGTLIVRVPFREDLKGYAESKMPYKFVHIRNFDEYSLRLIFEKVFSCTFIEMSADGYYPSSGSFKWSLPVPRIGGIIGRLLYPIKVISTPLYRTLLRTLFHPVEMNFVFEKNRRSGYGHSARLCQRTQGALDHE